MINWFDMPAEGLSNGGLFEVKELEVTENGTYEEKGEMYNKVVVNVEGGGGSSDWTKAIVRVKNNSSTALVNVKLDTFENDGFISAFLFKATIGVDTNAESIIYEANTDKTDIYYIYKNAYIILYALSIADPEAFQVEGLAEILTIPEAPPFIKVTGDCTITINDSDAQ